MSSTEHNGAMQVTHSMQSSQQPSYMLGAADPTSSALSTSAPTEARLQSLASAKATVTGDAAPDANGKKVSRPRKKKDEDNAATEDTASEKAKRPRKPRDPSKPPTSRKRLKPDQSAASDQTSTIASMKISDMVSVAGPSAASTTSAPAHAASDGSIPRATATEQDASQASKPSVPARGPYYDPIRGSSVAYTPYQPVASPQPAVRQSPSISSLINPSSTVKVDPSIASTTPFTVAMSPGPSAPAIIHESSKSTEAAPTVSVGKFTAESTKASSTKHKDAKRSISPIPSRSKDVPSALPPGNGLLSQSDFGALSADQPDINTDVLNKCIVIEVPMTSSSGNYVNFMKEVEKKYGFEMAHPRIAEHRRRMHQMAAASAALEPGTMSADEMAIDSDVDSGVEIGQDDASNADTATKVKRRTKRDAYDKDDDFIDDTELAWEQQALASGDGYFVWSGPLMPEKKGIDRADGSSRRGRGGRTRGGTRGGRSSADGAPKRGGPGSRGGKITATNGAVAKRRTAKSNKLDAGVGAATKTET